MKNSLYVIIMFITTLSWAHPGEHYVPRQAGTLLDDGEIITHTPYLFEFETYKQFTQHQYSLGMNKQQIDQLLPFDKFTQYQANHTVQVTEIIYRSAATNIAGLIFTPKGNTSKLLPIIIYNHDGYLRNAKISFSEIIELYRLAEQGYVVMASYFRGNGNSDGRADFTLGDVTDAYNLTMVAAKNIKQANIDKVGILGLGRGGTTAYHMAFHNDSYDAAIMMAAPTDYSTSHQLNHLDKHVFPYAVRHYKQDKKAALIRISPLKQIQHLNRQLPILLLHGTQDNQVLVSDSLNMATALNKQSQVYRMAIFEQTNHTFDTQILKLRSEIDYWFNKYLKSET